MSLVCQKGAVAGARLKAALPVDQASALLNSAIWRLHAFSAWSLL